MAQENDCENQLVPEGKVYINQHKIISAISGSKAHPIRFGRRVWMKFTIAGILLVFLTGITSLTLAKFLAQQPPLHIPQSMRSLLTLDPDTSEHSESHLLQDFKTNCFPPRPQFFSTRNRRGLHRGSEPLRGNGSKDFIAWVVPNESGTAELLKNSPQNVPNSLITKSVINETYLYLEHTDNGGSGDHHGNVQDIKKMESDGEENSDESYFARGQGNKEEITNAESPQPINFLHIEDLDPRESPWEKREDDDNEDNGEKERVNDCSECDDQHLTQHAFWKGEGDPKTIRTAQAKLMKKYMDVGCDPCNDFYQYACGNWGKYNPIPKDKAAFDTFEMLRESLDSILKELLEQQIAKSDSEAYIKTKNLYRSCTNYDLLKTRGSKPLLSLLEKLGGWPILTDNWNPTHFDWLWLMAQLRLYNNDILIAEWVGPDIKNSDEYVIQFDQTSLGLPTRDYYLLPTNIQYLEAYKSYLIKISILLGAPPEKAKCDAEEIISFETDLAKITSAPDERKNVSELYQRMTVGELRAYIPQVDWQRYLTIVLRRPCNISENVVIFALRYVEDLVSLLGKTEPRVIANYLLWRFVRHRVNNLDDRFQEAKQRFYFILFGREKSPPRWKNCVAQVNSNMGMAVGAMFVRKYFDENSKNDTLIMTKAIQKSFNEILNMTTWIDKDTKRLASEKVDAMMLRIGYPDFILVPEQLNERYKDVEINPDEYFENTLNILQHLTRVEQGHLGSPVNKSVWNTAPAVVNAYYSRNKNQIMFPAGILQPPFYHRYFPKSLNYGGIGVVIGHEITHGFDDKGRLFDKDGNLHRWWKDQAINNFHERAQCIIEQYSKYTVQEVGMQIDGINTQGENIADNGGIKQAFRAYKRWLTENGPTEETLPGMNATGLQLFFLNFAQVWCGDTRPAASRNKLKTAVHSPGKFRVIGTLSNSVDFSEVFKCPMGSPMNPVKKCSVW